MTGGWVISFPKHEGFAPDWTVIKSLFKFGLPTGFQGIVMNVGGVLLLGAAAAIAGQNLGAGKPERAVEGVKVAERAGRAPATIAGPIHAGAVSGAMNSRRGRLPLVALAMLVVTVALVACGCAHLRTPEGPVMPDRPGFTDTPTVLPSGAVQLELGFTDDRSAGDRYQSVGEALLRVGVAGPLELRLFANSFATRSITDAPTKSGMEDLKVGAKLRLIETPDSVHGLRPNLSLLIATTLPTGAPGIGAGAAQPEAKLAASWTTKSPVSFNTNLGIGAVYAGAAWSDHAWLSQAVWCAATPRVALFAEGIRVQQVSGSALSSSYVDGGLTLLVGERMQVDARIGRGVSDPVASERFVGLGLGLRF